MKGGNCNTVTRDTRRQQRQIRSKKDYIFCYTKMTNQFYIFTASNKKHSPSDETFQKKDSGLITLNF